MILMAMIPLIQVDILRTRFRNELTSYATEYLHETNQEIPANYIENQLNQAMEESLVDPALIEEFQEEPDFNTWRDSDIREFLYSYADIVETYPF